jgi:hypothetical protein
VKTFLTIAAVLVIAASTTVVAQVPAQNPKQVVFFGGSYDHPQGGFATAVGGGTKLAGGLWTLYSAKVGATGALEPDLCYMIKPYGGWAAGILAGPNWQWIPSDNEGVDPVAYMVSAGGVIVGYHWQGAGIYVAGKYLAGPSNSGFNDGWRLAVLFAFSPK